ncbi:hypothetical protein BC826DRAFT_538761 [Russula brevipes]|nr:hypothetical protein BC826DRAFT_538761 [Russula brevipes]
MSPAQPSLSYTPVVNVEVVTVTLFSSSTSSPSTVPSSSGGRSRVPIGAIVGGIAGGMALALSVVLVWKYWGRVIQRTEKQQRKEAQDMLTVRENTRRNATSGFQPESQYRPMLNFNPENRRVTFLARTPTRADQAETDDTTPSAVAPMEEKGNNQEAPTADPGTGETEAQQPLPSSALPAASLLAHDSPAELDRKGEGGERPVEEKSRRSLSPTPSRGVPRRPPSPSPSRSAPRRAPSPSPSGSAPRRVPSPSPSGNAPRRAPSPSPSGSTSRRSPSPASSHSTSKRASLPVPSTSKRTSLPAPSHHTSKRASLPVPSRSVRMRTPQRLPDPPPVPPLPTLKASDTRPSTANSTRSVTSTSTSPARPPSPSSSRIQGTVATSRSTSPVSSVNPIPTAGSSTASLQSSSSPSNPATWTRSPLRNSVLPSERPVIMPRPKNASAPAFSPVESQPASHVSSTLASTPSQYSGASGEQSMARGFFDSLGRIRSFVGASGGNMRPASTQSSASANPG